MMSFLSFACRSLLLIMVVLGTFPGCEKQPPPANLRENQVLMNLGGGQFKLEIADTPEKQKIGLMERRFMPANEGMIFVFPNEQPRAFYMRDTYIPLDIIYLSADGRIISIKQMKPLDETSVPSDGPCKYAIELNAGTAQKMGLKVGDVLTIPEKAREPR